MKNLILSTLVFLLLPAMSSAQSDPIMEMVCLATISNSDGSTHHRGQVFVITQTETGTYPASVFVDRFPQFDGKPLIRTDWVSFNLKYFKQAPSINEGEDASAYATDLTENHEFEEISTQGYRYHARVGAHYYFGWGSNTVEEFIRYNPLSPEDSIFDDGNTGGVLDCLPPYLK